MRRALLTVLAALAFAAPAQADTINVTSSEDSGNALCPSANQCTLRRAIDLSKSNGNTNPDTIVLPAGIYQLALGPLLTNTTNTDVTIQGAGADTTIVRAAANQRVMEIQGESAFTLRGLTLAGGNAVSGDGGNLFVSSGEARLDHVRLTGGRAFNGGGLAIQNGQVLADHTLIDGNTASTSGGGVASMAGSELSLLTSTVTGNQSAEGAGIAISNQQTLVTLIVLSTIAHNTSSGWSGGGVAVRQNASAPTVTASILAGNIGVGVPGNPQIERNCSGTLTDGGGNVESRTECGFTRPQSRQLAFAPVATALVSDGGTLPVLPIGADSPARDLAGPCSGTDQRDVQRPSGAACDAGAYEYVASPAPPPVATPTPVPPVVTPVPTPVVNNTIVVAPTEGTVLVKRKGSSKYEPLDVTKGIPVGSTVDTRKGRVRLTSIPKAGAPPESAWFWDGIFTVTQKRGITDLKLTEALAACRKQGRASSAAAKKAKKRKLWGDGKGSFRTTGRYSAATVRGTKWLVEDSCSGTLTRVTQGSVTVKAGKVTKIVRAGKRYLARPRR